MGSSAMIYIPRFIKIRSAIQTLMNGANTQTYKEYGDLMSLLLFFKIRKAG
jgi:hypothetical protein